MRDRGRSGTARSGAVRGATGGNPDTRAAHLLEVNDLAVRFTVDGEVVRAVDGVSYHVDEGEIVAFVGESGSGKSVTHHSTLRLIPSPPGEVTGGEVLFQGGDLLAVEGDELRSVRGGQIGIVFQEPTTSLNPVLTVGRQIAESLILHAGMTKAEAMRRAAELLATVGIPDPEQRLGHYPHQLSGGMRQRVMIAMALSCGPKVLIADEATTALDVTTQAQILDMLRDVVRRTGVALLLVTHNLGIVARYAERIYVMYAGTVVESGTTSEIFARPRHPYTRGLLEAVPRLDDDTGDGLFAIPGVPPRLVEPPRRCRFLPRCAHRMDVCFEQPEPALTRTAGQHHVACYADPAHLPTDLPTDLPADLPADQLSSREPSHEPAGGTHGPRAGGGARADGAAADHVLDVRALSVRFPVRRGLLRRTVGEVAAVEDVSFAIRRGETLGLVGESGCGKSTVARSVLGMYQATAGAVRFEGRDIAHTSAEELRRLRRDMALVFQDPYGSLDPHHTAGRIVGEPLRVHRTTGSRAAYEARVRELFELVGLDPRLRGRRPHEFSGGQRQRLAIARALANDPSLIVCDEAVSALDVSIQAQIINLLEDLQQRLSLSYLFIGHDLAVVRHISDRVAVMYLGRIVEMADWNSLYENPQHPYTRQLLASVPNPDPDDESGSKAPPISGEVPSPLHKPPGCAFSSRCPLATAECNEIVPALRETEPGHQVACIKVT